VSSIVITEFCKALTYHKLVDFQPVGCHWQFLLLHHGSLNTL